MGVAFVILLAAVLVGVSVFGNRAEAPQQAPVVQTSPQPGHADEIPTVPAPGMVTMLDIGATECIPCKMMAPVIEELKKEYEGRAAVLFIDVWKHPDQGRRFGIQSIPTQIFYDAKGQEAGRHVGFLDKDSIKDAFAQLGVK
jgi:thioredoxin 1